MPTRLLLLLLLVIAALFAPPARAESTRCEYPVMIIADGRVTQSTFPTNTTYWYGIYAQAGHSYSVEFAPPADNYFNTDGVQLSIPSVYGPTDLQYCHGPSSLTVTQNSGYGPVIQRNVNGFQYGAGRRVSFTAQGAGLHLISITNVQGAGSYSFRAVDTTLFNIRWSTCGGFDDQWGFLNLSDMPVTATFTVYDLTNRAVGSVQFTIPPGGEVVRYSNGWDLNLPRNSSGYGILSHNGPPSAVLADAYMISASGAAVIYSKFEGGGSR